MLLLSALGFLSFTATAQVPGDARRGAQTFQAQGCIACHNVSGTGGHLAPDLGVPTGPAWEPAQMAARMWTHAPQMWGGMLRQGITPPRPSAQEAADLFAYFYGARYSQPPANAERGRRLADKHCAACHSESRPAPRAFSAGVLEDPIALAGSLWNHAAGAQHSRPRLNTQQLSDILRYKTSPLPGDPRLQPAFAPGLPGVGAGVFRAKCSGCHQYAPANRFPTRSLADFQTAMWNHAPAKEALPAVSAEEMRALVGYLWNQHYFDERGSADNGKRVFVQKRCATCHALGSGSAPRLDGRTVGQGSWSMMQAVWQHRAGSTANEDGAGPYDNWPRFDKHEMADLVSYLSSLRWLRARSSASPKP